MGIPQPGVFILKRLINESKEVLAYKVNRCRVTVSKDKSA